MIKIDCVTLSAIAVSNLQGRGNFCCLTHRGLFSISFDLLPAQAQYFLKLHQYRPQIPKNIQNDII